MSLVRLGKIDESNENGNMNEFSSGSLFGAIAPPPPAYSSLALKSVTPPAVPVGSSLSLDQLLQSTGAKHM